MAQAFLEKEEDCSLDEHDAIDAYFDCIISCDLNDGVCVEHCVVVHLRQEPEDAEGRDQV